MEPNTVGGTRKRENPNTKGGLKGESLRFRWTEKGDCGKKKRGYALL